MLFLLRKIRNKLLKENKIKSYLLYAIGEIFLVVIGIMIAVTLNNLNEQRKAKIKSYSYLQRLNEDMEDITKRADWAVKGTEGNLKLSIIAQEALESGELPLSKQTAFEDYLKKYYQFQITIQEANTFNEMHSAGELSLIENRWIRDAFTDLSASRDFIMEVNRAYHNAVLQNAEAFETHIRYRIENFETDSARSIVSYDFDAMAADAAFVNKISRQSKTWSEILRMYKGYNSDVLQLKDSIQAELNKFN